MNKYKNISDQDLTIPNIGIVKSGEVVETEFEINNQNLEEVVNNKKSESKKNKDEE